MSQNSSSIERLVDEAYKHLESLGYSRYRLKYRGKIWQTFRCWAEEHDIQYLTEEVVKQFLKTYDIPYEELTGKPRYSVKYRSRVRTSMRMLHEYAFNGWWQLYCISSEKIVFPPAFEPAVKSFLEHWKLQYGVNPQTLKKGKRNLFRFITFMASSQMQSWQDFQPSIFSDYFISQKHMQPVSLANYASILRRFFHYLWLEGFLPKDFSLNIPKIPFRRSTHLPVVWHPGEIEKLLAAVDRNSPTGKRNYAILTLVTRLGLRAGEIRTLKLDDINWEKAQLELFQPKTGNTVLLPVSEEVGQALIDYIRYGRPPVTCREVFVRHYAPFTPLPCNNSLYYMVTFYRKKAQIPLKQVRRGGLHSLRHAFASRLLEENIPMETIASILGHSSVETTRVYTKVNLDALREAALDPEEACHE